MKTKKSRYVLLVFLLAAFLLCSCNNGQTDSIVQKSIGVLKQQWQEIYSNSSNSDCHFQIKNTRIIKIKETDIEPFNELDYVVEFVLFTNYFGSSPYYENCGTTDSVLIYKDGTAEATSINPFRMYRAKTYNYNYDDIIETITDLGNKYNTTTKLKATFN